MNRTDEKYQLYVQILKEELVPALGCTEPIAIAYVSAKAREVLGAFPDRIVVECSGNIVKNVKGVIVPGTGNLRGIEASAIIGAVAGDASRKLEVLTGIREADVQKTKELIAQGICEARLLENGANLHVIVTASSGEHSALVELRDSHTNIVRIEKDGEIIYTCHEGRENPNEAASDRTALNIADIYDFANTVQIADIKDLLDHQIEDNMRIAEEGLNKPYGASVGATLLECYGDDIKQLQRHTRRLVQTHA